MSHTISDPSKLTVNTLSGTHATIGTMIQTYLRTLVASDKIIDITIVKKSHGNNYVAYVTFEDQ